MIWTRFPPFSPRSIRGKFPGIFRSPLAVEKDLVPGRFNLAQLRQHWARLSLNRPSAWEITDF